MEIFEINKKYKLETTKGLFFTATITAISETHIKFNTVRNETISWLKSDILRATQLERNEGEN